MIDRNIRKKHILKALSFIDQNGIPARRKSTKYNLFYSDKLYPPKYVLSIATKILTGKELDPSEFNGGKETNDFLMSLGFTIKEDSKILTRCIPVDNKVRICNALIQIESNNWDVIDHLKKLALLSSILSGLTQDTDILVLPAGFFNVKNKKPEAIFADIEKALIDKIRRRHKNLVICFGVDSIYNNKKKDQLALSVNRTGIVSIARKFHHTDNDINLADSAFEIENGKSRCFEIKNKRAYLAVCYDIYGISNHKLKNELGCDFVLGLIHGFGKTGGDSDFARKGLAGAAKQWGCHVYGSAVFSENRNPVNWPSGVEWRHGEESVKGFKYEDIRINGKTKIITTSIAIVYLQYYSE